MQLAVPGEQFPPQPRLRRQSRHPALLSMSTLMILSGFFPRPANLLSSSPKADLSNMIIVI
jgi:hypothetical protein